MPSPYANLAVPDARRLQQRRDTHPYEEVRALVRVIQRNARGPRGETASSDDIAALLGIGRTTLDSYCSQPRRDRARQPRGVPYTVLYALEALASCPAGVVAALWPA